MDASDQLKLEEFKILHGEIELRSSEGRDDGAQRHHYLCSDLRFPSNAKSETSPTLIRYTWIRLVSASNPKFPGSVR
jgi:hypothetical protein